ncbi:hypothetical protein DWW38_04720 [Coprobacillus sp. AF15-30]|nr:hypothetical protein DWW38_04720 [Coprobacillus sp. AF15-30]
MKKIILAVLVVLALAGSFLAGASLGARDVIDNQIITNKDHQEGFYEADYRGQAYSYWYE